jgi:hypothetical protein
MGSGNKPCDELAFQRKQIKIMKVVAKMEMGGDARRKREG